MQSGAVAPVLASSSSEVSEIQSEAATVQSESGEVTPGVEPIEAQSLDVAPVEQLQPTTPAMEVEQVEEDEEPAVAPVPILAEETTEAAPATVEAAGEDAADVQVAWEPAPSEELEDTLEEASPPEPPAMPVPDEVSKEPVIESEQEYMPSAPADDEPLASSIEVQPEETALESVSSIQTVAEVEAPVAESETVDAASIPTAEGAGLAEAIETSAPPQEMPAPSPIEVA
jgi:hypothetical protein